MIIRKLRRRKGLRNLFVKLPRDAVSMLGTLLVTVEDRGDHLVVKPGGETPLRWGGFLEVPAEVAERWGTRYVVVEVGSGSVTVRPASGEDLARLRPSPSPVSIVRELARSRGELTWEDLLGEAERRGVPAGSLAAALRYLVRRGELVGAGGGRWRAA